MFQVLNAQSSLKKLEIERCSDSCVDLIVRHLGFDWIVVLSLSRGGHGLGACRLSLTWFSF